MSALFKSIALLELVTPSVNGVFPSVALDEVASELSIGIPSTTNSGSNPPEIELLPLIFIEDDAPGVPDEAVT
ncbi:MAG: hypothetical protein DDT42_02002 [candidate division WS2 bacterium]|uniref:Uncharacterized protein n=1 Tax=Psychracetigena formicireducens TaxID=2986056 RepID=A0A9E2BIB0_PSYF1|nr:hypothetical protein [Candidatus Psychracetigena formicireducens]